MSKNCPRETKYIFVIQICILLPWGKIHICNKDIYFVTLGQFLDIFPTYIYTEFTSYMNKVALFRILRDAGYESISWENGKHCWT